jgi:hypothetical protein
MLLGANAQLFEKSYRINGLALTANKSIVLHDSNIIQLGGISTNPAQHDIVIIKTKFTNGDTIWSKEFHAVNMIMSDMEVAEINNHHLMIAANGTDSGTTHNYHHLLLIELDSAGNLLQSQIYNNLGAYSGM